MPKFRNTVIKCKDRLFPEYIIIRENRETTLEELNINHQLLQNTFKKHKRIYFTGEKTKHAARFINALQMYRKHESQIPELPEEGRQQEAEALFEGPAAGPYR